MPNGSGIRARHHGTNHSETPPHDAYLTVKRACEIAGIGRTTFYKLLDDPRSGLASLTFRIPGLGHIRILECDFCRWLESSGARRPYGKARKTT
jgi:hypothetical protein